MSHDVYMSRDVCMSRDVYLGFIYGLITINFKSNESFHVNPLQFTECGFPTFIFVQTANKS